VALKINLIGPFSIKDDQGIDRRPKLMKSKAIVAVLAATPGHRHSRSWFQGLLWADRQRKQGLASLRSALTDIRRNLGPFEDALITDHVDIALNPELVSVDIHSGDVNQLGGFLEGFDIAHADEFEDWLRQARSSYENSAVPAERAEDVPTPARPATSLDVSSSPKTRLYLASMNPAPSSVTHLQCETLVDGLAKSVEDLSFAEVVDGRGYGVSMGDFVRAATEHQCTLMLVSVAAQADAGAIARLKVIDIPSGALVWSKSLEGTTSIDLQDPFIIGVVAEFVDVLAERLYRTYQANTETISPQLLGVAGINHGFKLGFGNYKTAEDLLKRAYEHDPRGSYLAWRAYLRTLLIGEQCYSNREAVVEEGIFLSRRALEVAPNNSMVLAVCAHVENMLRDDYERAFELSARALQINRCNPIAWIGLGASAVFLGEENSGHRVAKIGARMSVGSRFSFFADSWACATGLLAGKLDAATQFAERSHASEPGYAPPLRYLTVLYSAGGQIEKAEEMAAKLREREPDFTLETLRDEGYPSDSLRRAKLLDALPSRQI